MPMKVNPFESMSYQALKDYDYALSRQRPFQEYSAADWILNFREHSSGANEQFILALAARLLDARWSAQRFWIDIYQIKGDGTLESRLISWEHNVLLVATYLGFDAFVKYLFVEGKVDVNMSDKHVGEALYCAIEREHDSTFELVLNSSRVDVNMQDKNGHTPFIFALLQHEVSCFKLMLSVRAINVSAKIL